MVQDFIDLLPKDPGSTGLKLAILGSILGVAIWVLGARYSRPILTLATVLLGAVVGMQLPHWFGWQISGAGPAVGGALILGITGYVLHGMWVGIGLGTVLSSWAAMGCWILFRDGAEWAWPTWEADVSFLDYTSELWASVPSDVARILPYACATAMVTGLGLAIIWPKISLMLGWSMAGVTLLASMGVAALDYGRPDLLGSLPSPMWAQAAVLLMLVALGTLIQWTLAPRPALSKPGGSRRKSKQDDFEDDD